MNIEMGSIRLYYEQKKRLGSKRKRRPGPERKLKGPERKLRLGLERKLKGPGHRLKLKLKPRPNKAHITRESSGAIMK